MHRALIVSSKYDPATGYPDREAWRVSSKRLGLRLQQHGYAVEWLDPGAGLVRKLREALATEDPLSAVVVVFSGYVLLTETADPALLLSDEQVIALRLEQLCSKASRTFGRVLLVLDGVRGSSTRLVQEANPDAGEVSAETLLARMAARAVRSDNTGMLARVAPWGCPDVLPDTGLCEQLSRILENLDDAQALATPELELNLLDSETDDGSTVLCRHSKPAFVFLPARRFASEPPKPTTASAPRLDVNIDPHTSRDEDDDREAWTPPPESASRADQTTPTGAIPADTRPSRPELNSREAPPAITEQTPTSRAELPNGDDASDFGDDADHTHSTLTSGPDAPSLVNTPEPHAQSKRTSDTLGTPPPLPFERASVPAASLSGPTGASRVTAELGTPPPLPFERALSAAGEGSVSITEPAPVQQASPVPLSALPSPSSAGSSLVAPSPLVTSLPEPPPLPPVAPPPLPTIVSPQVSPPPLAAPIVASPPLPVEPPPLPVVVSPLAPPLAAVSPPLPPPLPPSVSPPPPLDTSALPVDTHASALPAQHDLGIPPPLPSERGALAVAAPAAAKPSATSGAPAIAPSADASEHSEGHGDEPLPLNAPPTLPTGHAAHISETHPDAPADVEATARPSQHPSRPSPPPRKRRESAPDEPLHGAPSLPPPVVSPESWRPQAAVHAPPRDEAALLERAQAYLASNQLDLALSHARECLTSFPESAQALQIAGNVLVSRGDFVALAALYDELIARLAPTQAAQLCAAASRLWQTQLHDPTRARALLEHGLRLDATNSSLQREFAELLDASGAHEEALGQFLAALRSNPFSPSAAQATFQRLTETNATELTFSVACILSFLGHATNRVVDTIAAHRGASLPRPNRSLVEDDYRFGLDVTDVDPELTRVVGLLEPYAQKLELPKPKQQRQLLESLRAEDVERSTTMLARTFGWTCRLLTLGTPALYLAENDSLPQLLPVEGSNFVVGKSLGRGLSVSELAFLWGRSLSWSRPQTRILYTLPSVVKLTQFLRAAGVAAGLQAPSGTETKALAKALRKEVSTQGWDVLRPALVALDGNVEQRVEVWKHAADRAANRVGLVASGDPELAARTLDRFPTTDGGSRKTQLSELLSFALSDEYLTLRQRLGLHLG